MVLLKCNLSYDQCLSAVSNKLVVVETGPQGRSFGDGLKGAYLGDCIPSSLGSQGDSSYRQTSELIP